MRRSIAIVLGLLLTPLPAPAFLEVPGTYATIQEAIDAADEGDVVRVGPGIYTESVRIAEKAVVLRDGDPGLHHPQRARWREGPGQVRFPEQPRHR
jgi:hypothetical protein